MSDTQELRLPPEDLAALNLAGMAWREAGARFGEAQARLELAAERRNSAQEAARAAAAAYQAAAAAVSSKHGISLEITHDFDRRTGVVTALPAHK